MQNEQLEKGLVSHLLNNPADFDVIAPALDEQDFHHPVTRRLFVGLRALRKMSPRWSPYDVLGFCEARREDVTELVTGHCDFTPRVSASKLRQLRVQRDLSSTMRRGAIKIESAEEDLLGEVNRVMSDLDDLRRRATTLEPTDLGAATERILRRAAMAKTGQVRAIRMGQEFYDIWSDIRGLMPGRLYILAGVAGTGKTAVAMHWAFHGAERPLFVTSEMTEDDLLTRLMSQLAGVPQPVIDNGEFSDAEFERLEAARERIMQSDLHILEAHDKTAEEVAASIMEMHRARDFDLIVHDYLQLFRKPKAAMSEYEAVSASSRTMMMLAKRLGPPVLQLAQLNRELERRDNPEPKKSDLRGSGTIEQDADGIFLLHRPSDYADRRSHAPFTRDPSALMIKMDKNRSGPRGRWYVETDFRTYRFRQMDPVRLANETTSADRR